MDNYFLDLLWIDYTILTWVIIHLVHNPSYMRDKYV